MARFAAVDQNSPQRAIDDTATPPWCMVPLNSRRRVQLVDGPGLTIDIFPAAAAQVLAIDHAQDSPADRPVRDVVLVGKQAGPARVRALRGAVPQAELDVQVMPAKTFWVSFIKIIDVKGRKTFHKVEDYQKLLQAVTNIYEPQVNFTFLPDVYGSANVPFDLEKGVPFADEIVVPAGSLPRPLKAYSHAGNPVPCVMGRRPGPMGCNPNDADVLAVNDPGLRAKLTTLNIWSHLVNLALDRSDFTVLVVPTFDVPRIGSMPSVLAFTIGRACLFSGFGPGFTLAHEIGHWLLGTVHDTGPDSHSKNSEDLMYATARYTWRIRKDQALKMGQKDPKPPPWQQG